MSLNTAHFEEVKRIFTAYLENQKTPKNARTICDFGGDIQSVRSL